MAKNRLQTWFFWIGLLIVFASHISMLIMNFPQDQIMGHAIINLIAGILILASSFMRK